MKDNPNLVHGQSADALEKGELRMRAAPAL